MALAEKLPELSLGSAESEAWFKVGVQWSLVLKGLSTEESKRHSEQEEITKWGFSKGKSGGNAQERFPWNPAALSCAL